MFKGGKIVKEALEYKSKLEKNKNNTFRGTFKCNECDLTIDVYQRLMYIVAE